MACGKIFCFGGPGGTSLPKFPSPRDNLPALWATSMITLSGYILKCRDMVESLCNLTGCSWHLELDDQFTYEFSRLVKIEDLSFANRRFIHTNSAVSSKLKTSRSRIGALCDCNPVRASNSSSKFVRYTPARCRGGDGGKKQWKFWDAFLMT